MLRRSHTAGTLVLVAWAVCLPTLATASSRAPVHPLACVEGGDVSPRAQEGARSNDELMSSEAFQRAIADVQRLRIVAAFCELRPDTLTLELAEGAFRAASTDYNLSRVYAAYRGLTEYEPATALELRYEDRLVGWYANNGLSWVERPTPPPAAPPSVATEAPSGVGESDEVARRGVHFSAGLGAGSFDRQCRGCDFEGELGVSGYLSVGRWLGRATVVGVEGTGWTKEEFDRRSQVYSVMAQVTRYASATSGLFLRAGAGLVGYSDDFELTALGPGFSGRLGYEFGIGTAQLAPYLGYVRSFDGLDMKRDGDEVGFNFVISQLQFGVGVTIY